MLQLHSLPTMTLRKMIMQFIEAEHLTCEEQKLYSQISAELLKRSQKEQKRLQRQAKRKKKRLESGGVWW